MCQGMQVNLELCKFKPTAGKPTCALAMYHVLLSHFVQHETDTLPLRNMTSKTDTYVILAEATSFGVANILAKPMQKNSHVEQTYANC